MTRGDITYLCELGGRVLPYAPLFIPSSSLPALSFLPTIAAPSLLTILLPPIDRQTDALIKYQTQHSQKDKPIDRPTDGMHF